MSKYYHRGKEARMHGRDRILPDGRVSVKNRQDFYEGWDEQDRHMLPKPTPEQAQETDEALAGIRAFLEANRKS